MVGEPGRRRTEASKHIDLKIGRNIRMRRISQKMSQQELATQLDLTFQQVQKYEKGANRIAFSRAIEIAEILKCRTSDFLDGIEGVNDASDPAFSVETARAMQMFEGLSAQSKRAIIGVIKALIAVRTGEDNPDD